MNSAKCNSCGAAIRWVRVTSKRTGKTSAMPVNAEPDPARGSISIDSAGEATVLTRTEAALFQARPDVSPKLYLSHFATCPNSARHRTK
jgi:hypothetical protein